jgi:diguanylate cyclase (GGDEF)-like protein
LELDGIAQQPEQIRRLAESALFAPKIAIVGLEGIVASRNPAWDQVSGHPLIDILARVPVGRSIFTVARTGSPQADHAVQNLLVGIHAVLEGRVEAFQQEFPDPPASPQRWFAASVSPLLQTKQVVLTVSDLTALRIAEGALTLEAQRVQSELLEMRTEWNRLESLVTLDGLTGLKNYRTLQENLHREWERSQRSQASLSLLLLDVDHFKRYNDTYGHIAGNVVLQHLADALRSTAREIDFVARYGGEEFAILLPDTNEEGAHVMAQRVQTALRNVAWANGQVTVSIGISCWEPGSGAEPPDAIRLIQQADEALYAAKQQGRDTVCRYSSLSAGTTAALEWSDGERL